MSEPIIEKLAKASHWESNHASIWLATMLHLRRNVERFKFPAKLDLNRRQQLVSLLGKELKELKSLGPLTLFKAEDLTAHEKELMIEHFFSHENILPAHQGEAFVLNEESQFFFFFFFHEHIHLHLIVYSVDI
ncbi:MAG: hypothetical protein KDK65_07750 [Chlamydiia bacterium]|nr:hypothetical protein [Chlamydiia bacterium]